ncbi:MAG: hypothetical protein ABSF45_26135 [Terriglobia bacterium]|jgi:hypothetical protein
MLNDMDKRARVARREAPLNVFGAFDPEPAPTCCGKDMQPRLDKAPDESEESSFVTVWCCLHCGKTII